MKAVAALVAFSALLLSAGASAGVSEIPGTRVAAVEISGTTRSDREAVLMAARIQVGDPWSDGLEREVLTNLRNTRLFYDEQVEAVRDGDAVTLRLRLKDKWTLIPIPLVIVRSGESMVGFSVLESNLLGLGKMVYASAAAQNGSPGGSIVYVDPRVRGTDFQVFGYFAHYDARQRVWDEDHKIGSYRERSTAFSVAGGYRIAHRTNLSLGFRAQWFREHDADEGVGAPDNAKERAAVARLRYEGDDWDEELRTGFSGQLMATWGLPALGDEVGRRELKLDVRDAFNPVGRQTLLVGARAYWTNEPDHTVAPVADFLRGYEGGRFRPDRLLGVSAEYQVPFARYREAALSTVGFADAAVLRDAFHSLAPKDLQADAGIALAVYIRRVALPVFQIYAAYGFSTGHLLPGLSLGLAFQ